MQLGAGERWAAFQSNFIDIPLNPAIVQNIGWTETGNRPAHRNSQIPLSSLCFRMVA